MVASGSNSSIWPFGPKVQHVRNRRRLARSVLQYILTAECSHALVALAVRLAADPTQLCGTTAQVLGLLTLQIGGRFFAAPARFSSTSTIHSFCRATCNEMYGSACYPLPPAPPSSPAPPASPAPPTWPQPPGFPPTSPPPPASPPTPPPTPPPGIPPPALPWPPYLAPMSPPLYDVLQPVSCATLRVLWARCSPRG